MSEENRTNPNEFMSLLRNTPPRNPDTRYYLPMADRFLGLLKRWVKKHVYLCGGINGLSDADCKNWREYAKEHLALPTIDPMRRDYRGKELDHGIAAEIVNEDLADIAASYIVLANHPKPSTGTDMEIFYAFRSGKTVVTIVPPDSIPSPWLIHHSTILVTSLSEAINYINANFV